jgi:hypothetical protein
MNYNNCCDLFIKREYQLLQRVQHGVNNSLFFPREKISGKQHDRREIWLWEHLPL